MKTHVLQSKTWRQFQKEIGRKVIEGDGDGWSYIGLIENDRFGRYVYVPYGPHAVNKKALQQALDDLVKKAKEIGTYVVHIEPTLAISLDEAKKMFKYKGFHRQAHRTIRIDLTRSEDEIIQGMNKTRGNEYRNYSNKGLVMEKSNTVETLDLFYDFLKISSQQKSFYIRDKKFFENIFEKLIKNGNANLFAAKRDGKVEVIALTYDDEDTRYYAQVGRDLSDKSIQANAPLISYMIIDAKRSGKKYFDLYGISESDDKIDEKSGFTSFKKTFGGEIIQYAGAWEIPISKPKYHIKKTLATVKKIIKK